MKTAEKYQALLLRRQGYSINEIAARLNVAKSSISIWVRDVQLTNNQLKTLRAKPFTTQAIEKRRKARLASESDKRESILLRSEKEIKYITRRELWLMGVMLYWAEGGKTQRMVRFSNGDPAMIKIMMHFFRDVCKVPNEKFRGHIHIHPHLDYHQAEHYWAKTSSIPISQFFKTYRKQNISSKNTRNTLPNGVMDIYVMDSALFLKISGWAQGVFSASTSSPRRKMVLK